MSKPLLYKITSPLRWVMYLARPDRVKLARKKDLSLAEARRIVRDPDPQVRRELAWNKSTSEEIIVSLLQDPDRQVASVARRRYIKATMSGV
ncbi:MAG: hypothetical protein IPM23_12455 [Candidatus Melainabacteria bacterium]|nr:hypothetical protein [Candidatus Melainabacteria bacterium]